MNRLIDDVIFQILETSENAENLKNTYVIFKNKLLNFSIRESNIPFCYRSLRELELKLQYSESLLSRKEHTSLKREKQEIIRKLSILCQIEKEMFQMRLDRPEQFQFVGTMKKQCSVLRWKGSLNDLMELIIAFIGTGIITTTTGENLTASMLIQAFESLFNVRFGRSNDKKAAVFRRKKNCACLLDRLRENLETKVRDYYAK